MLVGLPGPYNWRGAIFKNIIAETLSVNFEWYTSPVETVPKLPPPNFPDPVPMDFDSYMGELSESDTVCLLLSSVLSSVDHTSDLEVVKSITTWHHIPTSCRLFSEFCCLLKMIHGRLIALLSFLLALDLSIHVLFSVSLSKLCFL